MDTQTSIEIPKHMAGVLRTNYRGPQRGLSPASSR